MYSWNARHTHSFLVHIFLASSSLPSLCLVNGFFNGMPHVSLNQRTTKTSKERHSRKNTPTTSSGGRTRTRRHRRSSSTNSAASIGVSSTTSGISVEPVKITTITRKPSADKNPSDSARTTGADAGGGNGVGAARGGPSSSAGWRWRAGGRTSGEGMPHSVAKYPHISFSRWIWCICQYLIHFSGNSSVGELQDIFCHPSMKSGY